jgi:hypothetical protein
MKQFNQMSASYKYGHPKGLCYVSEQYKLIFIPIPKVASSTFRRFDKHLNLRVENIMELTDLTADPSYKVLTFIRDPFERFISGYIEICKRTPVDSRHNLERKFYWRDGLLRFETFVNEVVEDKFDIHILSQKWFLTDYQSRPFKIDIMIEMESIERLLPIVLNEHGLKNIIIPHENKKDTTSKFDVKLQLSKYKSARLTILLYKFLNKILERLLHRPLPNSREINSYLNANRTIQLDIEKICDEDYDFINFIQNTHMTLDENGIFRRNINIG